MSDAYSRDGGEEMAETFLIDLFRQQAGVDIQLTWMEDGAPPASKRFPTHHADRAAREGVRLAHRGADVYVRAGGMDHHTRLASGARGGSAHTTLIGAVWADLDFYDPDDPKKADYPPTDEVVLELLGVDPSIVVHSGGGLQGWWLFDEALLLSSPDARRRAEGLVEGFQKRLANDLRAAGYGTDANSFDLSRMMRLPGTFNHKKDVARPVEVISRSDRRYSVPELEAFVGDIALGPPVGGKAGRGAQGGSGYPLGGEFPDALVQTLSSRSQKFGPTWDRNRPDLDDKSASGYDFAIAGIAAYHGADDAQIAALIYHRRVHQGEQPEKALRADYIERTIQAVRSTLTDRLSEPAPGRSARTAGGAEQPGSAQDAAPETTNTMSLATAITGELPVKVGPSDMLFVYEGGVWRPGAKDIAVRVRELLGPKFTQHKGREVAGFLKSHHQEIWTDRHPAGLLNFRNGMVDIATLELRPHDPTLLSTTQLPVRWDPESEAPRIARFLQEVLHEDAVELVLEVFGLALYPGNPFHSVVFLYGDGQNGKSTLLHLMEELVGRDRVAHVSTRQLERDRFAGADLDGKLLNIHSEEGALSLDHTEQLKAISGGDTVRVERKCQDAYDIRPICLPVFATNKPVSSEDCSRALARRIVIIEFPHTFPCGPNAEVLRAELTTTSEIEGLAVMAVKALSGALKRGRLDSPASALIAHRDFRMRTEAAGVFLDNYCEFDPEFWVSRDEVRAGVRTWAANAGVTVTADLVYAALRDRLPQVTERSAGGVRGFAGVRLRFRPPS